MSSTRWCNGCSSSQSTFKVLSTYQQRGGGSCNKISPLKNPIPLATAVHRTKLPGGQTQKSTINCKLYNAIVYGNRHNRLAFL